MIVSQLRAGSVYALPDMALLAGSSFVYSQGLDRAFSTSPFNPAEEFAPEETAGRLRRIVNKQAISFELTKPVRVVGHLKQEAVPLNLIYAHNYYHFLIEWLPSLAHLLSVKAISDTSMIVSGLLHPNMWTALRYVLGEAQVPVLQLRTLQAVTCNKVITAPPSARAAQTLAGDIFNCWYNHHNLQLLRRRFEPLWVSSEERRRRLYVRRTSSVRRLTNSPEVERRAIEAGYAIVEPERMSLVEQIRLFSAASHIMGPTGAWVANLLFVPETAHVRIFCPETTRSRTPPWPLLGEALGIRVEDIYCPVSRRFERDPIHSDYDLPLDILDELLGASA